MRYDYPKICQDLIADLPQKSKEVIVRRFGLDKTDRETLESIGEGWNVTRERIRQIEEEGISRINPKLKNYRAVFQHFQNYFQKFGNVRKEDVLFTELGEGEFQNQVYFLLSLSGGFLRFSDKKDFWPFWAKNPELALDAKKTIDSIFLKIEKIGKPVALKEISSLSGLKASVLDSYLGISKKILKNESNFFGLKDWPEINPRGVKDKAYLVFKKEEKPLHFTEVAKMISGSLVQTVHNELIRDPRFVLIGRGVYALKDWGYAPGQVKDVIAKVLKEEKKPLSRDEILNKVLEQRQVQNSTIFLNLNNKNYFSKDPQGRYWIREI